MSWLGMGWRGNAEQRASLPKEMCRIGQIHYCVARCLFAWNWLLPQ